MPKQFKNLKLIDHPLLIHKLTMLRDKETPPWEFRKIMNEVGPHLAYEATRDLDMVTVEVDSPLEKTEQKIIAEDVMVVSILRAGNGMLDGVLQALPFAQVGHMGIYRDKFIGNTVEYYFKLPNDAKGKRVILVDPMVATSDTLCATIQRLKDYEVGSIRVLSLLVSPQALQKLSEVHPDVHLYSVSLERELNAQGYLLPGMGDAGDRLYGTL